MNKVYKVLASLDNYTFDVLTAVCMCAPGLDPTASGKHVAAVYYKQ